ncbi:MAG: Spy/CpxP family protein refolding chaperone [Gammaproteobacteria bacterium]
MNKPIMTTIAALALLGAGSAFAQSTPAPSAPPAKAGWHAKHHQSMADRLANFKSQLKITASQEAAWNGFTTALQGMRPAKPSQMMAKKAGGLTPAPEVFATMAKMAQQRAQKAQALSQAASNLYKGLSSTQRAVFDTHLADMHHSMKRHWRHHGKRMRPPMKMMSAPQPASGGNG